MDREIFYHGQELPIHVSINNNSKKSVKLIRVAIIQHCELTMVAAQYSCKVARLETKDGCPLGELSIWTIIGLLYVFFSILSFVEFVDYHQVTLI